jgi:4-amino-4-deoxy-L-arabinose transferase-like glycosyltransferase
VSAAGAQNTVSRTSAPPAAAPARGRFRAALLGITAAGVAIRVLYTLLESPWPPTTLDDQFYFAALPRLLADGEGFVRPFVFVFEGGRSLPTAEHPPLHSVALWILAELGGTSADAQRLTGAAFGAGTIALVGLLGRRMAGERTGLIAAGLAAVYPILVATDGALLSESLFVVLVAWSLLAALRLAEAPGLGRGAVLGVALGLAALTRGEALLLLPLLLLGVLRNPPGRRAAVAAVAAFAVVLTPWTIRNWAAFDQPVLISTNSGSAIGGANCRPTYFGDSLGGWRPECLRPTSGNEAEHMADLRREGVRYAREHAGRVPVVLAVRFARVWNVYDPLQVPEGRSARVWKLGVGMFFVLVPLAVAGAVLLRRRRTSGLWILLAPIVLVSVTALVTYGNQRFRAPAEITLVVLAAVALDALLRSRDPAARAGAPSLAGGSS